MQVIAWCISNIAQCFIILLTYLCATYLKLHHIFCVLLVNNYGTK